MQTISLQQLRDDAEAAVVAAQKSDVLVVEDGKVLAVVSRPRASQNFAEYWQRREALLQGITAGPDWDSTQVISEDRERS
jgi:hypothetical protein